MNKKILIGASIVTILILLLGGYYFFVYNKKTTQNTNPNAPFGNGSDSPILPQGGGVTQQSVLPTVSNSIEVKKGGLRKISVSPVSDGNFILSKASTTPIIRFIERSTGHIFEANLDSGVNTRITNTTIPKIEAVSWAIPGKSFLAQYIGDNSIQDTIIEVAATSTKATSTSPVDENSGLVGIAKFDIPQNIISASYNQTGSSLFYLIKGSRGIEGYTSTQRGEKPQLVWQFPTTEWISQWVSLNTITLTTKASNGIPGLLYNVDVKSKTNNLILSNIPGLTTNTSPQGTRVLYTSITDSTWKTSVYDVKYKVDLALPFVALPEKCVWTKNEIIVYCARPQAISSNSPDDWYQGLVSFTDAVWKYNIETSELTQVSDLQPDTDTTIDLLHPHLSQNEDYLVFTNKKDLSLWALPTK